MSYPVDLKGIIDIMNLSQNDEERIKDDLVGLISRLLILRLSRELDDDKRDDFKKVVESENFQEIEDFLRKHLKNYEEIKRKEVLSVLARIKKGVSPMESYSL